ncbi:hypothetical protein SAMN05414139_10253 [Burkholderia sp. D7]|nr:hypothetical protein SAMN05414139_10253 [Burkholderia sp. D7]
MANFETDDEIEAWIAESGEEAFESNITYRRFGGRRLTNAIAYRERKQAENAAAVTERQTTAAEAEASAAAEQVAINRKSLHLSRWALFVSMIAVIIAFAALLKGK